MPLEASRGLEEDGVEFYVPISLEGGNFFRGDFSWEGCSTIPQNSYISFQDIRSYPVEETPEVSDILLLYYKDLSIYLTICLSVYSL